MKNENTLTPVQKDVIFKMLMALSQSNSTDLYSVKIKCYNHKKDKLYYISTKKSDDTWTFPIIERQGKLSVLPEFKVNAVTVNSLSKKGYILTKGSEAILIKKAILNNFIPNQITTERDKLFFNKYLSKSLNITLNTFTSDFLKECTFEKTAYLKSKTKESGAFNHCIIDSDTLYGLYRKYDIHNKRNALETICKEHNIDFISVSNNTRHSVSHIVSYDTYDYIEKNGFQINQEFVMDLGDGVYCFDLSSDDSVSNMMTYLDNSDLFEEDDEAMILKLSYTGKVTRCIYGENHEGYLVLKDPSKIKIVDIEKEGSREDLIDFIL